MVDGVSVRVGRQLDPRFYDQGIDKIGFGIFMRTLQKRG